MGVAQEPIEVGTGVPHEVDIDSLSWNNYDEPALRQLFGELEFDTLGQRLFGKSFSSSSTRATVIRQKREEEIQARLFDEQDSLHAPHLLDVEVAQVLRRYAGSGDIDPERGLAALADLADFPIRRYPHGVNNRNMVEPVYVGL